MGHNSLWREKQGPGKKNAVAGRQSEAGPEMGKYICLDTQLRYRGRVLFLACRGLPPPTLPRCRFNAPPGTSAFAQPVSVSPAWYLGARRHRATGDTFCSARSARCGPSFIVGYVTGVASCFLYPVASATNGATLLEQWTPGAKLRMLFRIDSIW
jgi:hypothetical protein